MLACLIANRTSEQSHSNLVLKCPPLELLLLAACGVVHGRWLEALWDISQLKTVSTRERSGQLRGFRIALG